MIPSSHSIIEEVKSQLEAVNVKSKFRHGPKWKEKLTSVNINVSSSDVNIIR